MTVAYFTWPRRYYASARAVGGLHRVRGMGGVCDRRTRLANLEGQCDPGSLIADPAVATPRNMNPTAIHMASRRTA
jgi:hypothetical protein